MAESEKKKNALFENFLSCLIGALIGSGVFVAKVKFHLNGWKFMLFLFVVMLTLAVIFVIIIELDVKHQLEKLKAKNKTNDWKN